MRLGMVGFIAATVLSVTAPHGASAQQQSPPGTIPRGGAFHGSNGTTAPAPPQWRSATSPTADTTWVPDRYVHSPRDGRVFVPGHWERRLSDQQVFTPSLIGRTPSGGTVTFPAGTRPPV